MERGGVFGEIPASPSAFSRMEACGVQLQRRKFHCYTCNWRCMEAASGGPEGSLSSCGPYGVCSVWNRALGKEHVKLQAKSCPNMTFTVCLKWDGAR